MNCATLKKYFFAFVRCFYSNWLRVPKHSDQYERPCRAIAYPCRASVESQKHLLKFSQQRLANTSSRVCYSCMPVYIVSWRGSLWALDLKHGRSIKIWCIHLWRGVRLFVYRWDVCLADIRNCSTGNRVGRRHSDESYLGQELVNMPLMGFK